MLEMNMNYIQLVCAPIEQVLGRDSSRLIKDLWFLSCVHSAGALFAIPGKELPKKHLLWGESGGLWGESGGLNHDEIELIAARLGIELLSHSAGHEGGIE